MDIAQRQLSQARGLTAMLGIGGTRMPIPSTEKLRAGQQCVELSVKATFLLLDLALPKVHELSRQQFAEIADRLQQSGVLERLEEGGLAETIPLARMLFLFNLWGQVYLIAKYGYEDSFLAPPNQIFRIGEAQLALEHAEECLLAARHLASLSPDQLRAIAHGGVDDGER